MSRVVILDGSHCVCGYSLGELPLLCLFCAGIFVRLIKEGISVENKYQEELLRWKQLSIF